MVALQPNTEVGELHVQLQIVHRHGAYKRTHRSPIPITCTYPRTNAHSTLCTADATGVHHGVHTAPPSLPVTFASVSSSPGSSRCAVGGISVTHGNESKWHTLRFRFRWCECSGSGLASHQRPPETEAPPRTRARAPRRRPCGVLGARRRRHSARPH